MTAEHYHWIINRTQRWSSESNTCSCSDFTARVRVHTKKISHMRNALLLKHSQQMRLVTEYFCGMFPCAQYLVPCYDFLVISRIATHNYWRVTSSFWCIRMLIVAHQGTANFKELAPGVSKSPDQYTTGVHKAKTMHQCSVNAPGTLACCFVALCNDYELRIAYWMRNQKVFVFLNQTK